jgi:hypothetical protein
MKTKIIIHVDENIDTNSAIKMVSGVIEKGKISASGESYCYLTIYGDAFAVSTDKPKKGTKTYVFRVSLK